MRRDDFKFLGALLMTAGLAGVLVFSMHIQEAAVEAPGSAVDLARIEREVSAGKLSLHPAAYWELMDESQPSGIESSGVSYDQKLVNERISRGALSEHEASHWLPMEGVSE